MRAYFCVTANLQAFGSKRFHFTTELKISLSVWFGPDLLISFGSTVRNWNCDNPTCISSNSHSLSWISVTPLPALLVRKSAPFCCLIVIVTISDGISTPVSTCRWRASARCIPCRSSSRRSPPRCRRQRSRYSRCRSRPPPNSSSTTSARGQSEVDMKPNRIIIMAGKFNEPQ